MFYIELVYKGLPNWSFDRALNRVARDDGAGYNFSTDERDMSWTRKRKDAAVALVKKLRAVNGPRRRVSFRPVDP